MYRCHSSKGSWRIGVIVLPLVLVTLEVHLVIPLRGCFFRMASRQPLHACAGTLLFQGHLKDESWMRFRSCLTYCCFS